MESTLTIHSGTSGETPGTRPPPLSWRPRLPSACGSGLQKSGCRYQALLLSAAALGFSAFFLHFNPTPHVCLTPTAPARAAEFPATLGLVPWVCPALPPLPRGLRARPQRPLQAWRNHHSPCPDGSQQRPCWPRPELHWGETSLEWEETFGFSVLCCYRCCLLSYTYTY